MVKVKDNQFCVKNLKMKGKKEKKIFDLPDWGFEHQIFSNFPTQDFMEGEGDKIKSKQASKRDRTLLTLSHSSINFLGGKLDAPS